MKEYAVLLVAVCGISGAFATDYNLAGDWTIATNPNGAWSYGTKVETSPGVFNPFEVATIYNTSGAPWDRWIVANTFETCTVFLAPGGLWSFPANSVVGNAWTSYSGVAHWAGNAGTYDLSATFTGGGYATPSSTYPDSVVYVIKNNSAILFQQEILGFTSASTAQQVTLASGDYLDFIVAGRGSESRASIAATLTAVPEPSITALLGLAGLLFLRRNR